MVGPWIVALGLALTTGPSESHAEQTPADETRSTEPFPYRWSAGVGVGFPSTGLSFGRTFVRRWHLEAAVGTWPLPVVAVGGNVSLSRGFAVGRILTIAPGVTFDAVGTRFCSFGGCGERHLYFGAGPIGGLRFAIPRVERVHLSLGVGGGVTFGLVRQRMRLVQPHIEAVSLRIGW